MEDKKSNNRVSETDFSRIKDAVNIDTKTLEALSPTDDTEDLLEELREKFLELINKMKGI